MKIRNGQSELVEFSRIFDAVSSIESSQVVKLPKIGFMESGTNLKTQIPKSSDDHPVLLRKRISCRFNLSRLYHKADNP